MTTRKRIQSNMTLEAAIQAYKREMEISGIKILSTQECQIGLEALEKVKYLREIQGLPLPLPSETERG